MTKATYRTLPALIQTLTPFTHGSCHAYVDNDGQYRVISYTTLVATAKDENFWLSETKFSVTTSRLQNIIRKAWGLN